MRKHEQAIKDVISKQHELDKLEKEWEMKATAVFSLRMENDRLRKLGSGKVTAGLLFREKYGYRRTVKMLLQSLQSLVKHLRLDYRPDQLGGVRAELEAEAKVQDWQDLTTRIIHTGRAFEWSRSELEGALGEGCALLKQLVATRLKAIPNMQRSLAAFTEDHRHLSQEVPTVLAYLPSPAPLCCELVLPRPPAGPYASLIS
jgi:hypothetical protein